MAWLRRGYSLSWCVNHRLKLLQQTRHLVVNHSQTSQQVDYHKLLTTCRQYHNGRRTGGSPKGPSSHEVRRGFIEFFEGHDHLHVPSSSIVPRQGEGTYFVNAGMNQFKPIFLGTMDRDSPQAEYRRAVNSQRCVRVGGKHNDLEDVGRDTSHHTFFEMLGSWSFGDYFKKEACQYAWGLLTEVFRIPPTHLYVTYFSGDEQLNLGPDLECRDIWLQLGLPPERVIPSGSTDNFWDMGETGPCGPCTEIHYAHNPSGRLAHLVNKDGSGVLEIWNLVFMQFDRQRDGSLRPLPRHHVDTGMGLERLTAVLQGVSSNYDTDLFTPIFKQIHATSSCPPYQGLVGRDDARGTDTAYRIVADHLRMATVAIADGLRPGNKDQDSKLRLIIHRALRQARDVLRAPPNLLGDLVPLVIDTLGDAFPDQAVDPSYISEVMNHAEHKFGQMEQAAVRNLKRCLSHYGNLTGLTGDQVLEVCEGRFGSSVSVDILDEVCRAQGISIDIDEYRRLQDEQKAFYAGLATEDQVKLRLDQHHVVRLEERGVPYTDDAHKYNYVYEEGAYTFKPLEAKVLAILQGGDFVDAVQESESCGILLDRTGFYAEAGGQVADTGYLRAEGGDCHVHVSDVQTTSGYVLHTCQVHQGQLKVGDKVTVSVNQDQRRQCMNNHTGTHLINHALEKVLGNVRQQGSMVSANKFTFDFTCSKVVMDIQDIQKISDAANDLVQQHLPLYKEELPLEKAMKLNGLRCLQDEVYPSRVRVVSVGAPPERLLAQSLNGNSPTHSVELCGGTHVENTGDLEALVVTHVRGMSQGTRRVTAVTGPIALKALEISREMKSKIKEANDIVEIGTEIDSLREKVDTIEKTLSEVDMLPKVDRETLLEAVDTIKRFALNRAKNASTKDDLSQRLQVFLNLHRTAEPLVQEFKFNKPRDMTAVLSLIKPRVPVMLFSISRQPKKKGAVISGICFVPENYPGGFSAKKWAEYVALSTKGNHHEPQGKLGKQANRTIHVLSTPTQNATLHHVIDLASSYANLYENGKSLQDQV